jgi:hypothetical protein
MTTSTRVSLADLADASGIVPGLLAAEVRAIQNASIASAKPPPAPLASFPSAADPNEAIAAANNAKTAPIAA